MLGFLVVLSGFGLMPVAWRQLRVRDEPLPKGTNAGVYFAALGAGTLYSGSLPAGFAWVLIGVGLSTSWMVLVEDILRQRSVIGQDGQA